MEGKIKKPKFHRQTSTKMSKLGKRRKKKITWRKPKGRDSKMRLGEKPYGRRVKVGWGASKKDKKNIVRVESLKEFEKIKVKEILIGNVGRKKREEIIKRAKEKGVKILNKYRKIKSMEKENANS